MPIILAHADADKALAEKLAKDITRLHPDTGNLLIVLVSPAANADKDVQAQIVQAAEERIHILPLMVTQTKLPHLIDHLTPLNFTENAYPFDQLKATVTELTAPTAPRPLVTHTPKLRRMNLNSAIFISIPMALTFFIAIYLIGVKNVQMPQEEYDQVETARVEQRNTLIGPTLDFLLPHDAGGAANFDATLTAAPTRLSPFLAETATATMQGTYPVTSTPRPTSTPES